ncbi:MAG: hypothetical protein IPM24_11270 [Bryobacterales bacterium]|nr:hypothetical protein [Bryobacterales bacterium]
MKKWNIPAVARMGEALVVLCLCAIAGWQVSRQAWTAHATAAGDFLRAAAIDPANADALVLAARVLPPADPSTLDLLRRATAVSPRHAGAWMELATQLELAGDLAAAENALLEGAAADRRFGPAFSLAGFYFRQEDEAAFWFWALRAIAVRGADPSGAYRLAWQRGEHAAIWPRLAGRSALWSGYVRFLTAEGHTGALADTAPAAARLAAPAEAPDLLRACETLLRAGHAAPALAVWNALAGRGVIPHGAAGGGLVNGQFRQPVLQQGFDWRRHEAIARHDARRGEIAVAFDGSQSGFTEVLQQTVFVRPGSWILRFRAEPQGGAVPQGWAWEAAGGACTIRFSGDEEECHLAFPPRPALVRLVLVCRPRGQAGGAAEFRLRDVSLTPSP